LIDNDSTLLIILRTCPDRRCFPIAIIYGQEYPTESLRKISALQAILELAGKFLTGSEILLGIYCERKLAGNCGTSYALAGKNLTLLAGLTNCHLLWLANDKMSRHVFVF